MATKSYAFTYVGGNPIRYVDPEGLQFLPYSRDLNTRPSSGQRLPDGVGQRLNVVWGIATAGAATAVYTPAVIGAGIMAPELATGAANACKSPEVKEAALRACIGIGICLPSRHGPPDAWVGHREALQQIRDATNRGRKTESVTPWP